MRPEPGTLLSRLLAICAMLCMAVTLHAGFAAIQSKILNAQHLASGDLHLADGGWATGCDGAHDDCDDHLVAPHAHDGGPIHHHHSAGETQFAVVITATESLSTSYSTPLDVRPGEAAPLNGQSTATPDQPPRA